MNNKFLPITVFILLAMTSLFSVHHSYHQTRYEIVADLNQALALAMNDNGKHIITLDTLKAYRHLRTASTDGKVMIAVADDRFCRYLNNEKIKNNSFISFDIVDDRYRPVQHDASMISSDTLIITGEKPDEALAVRGYARLSSAAIFGMSDQRMAAVFALCALLWGIWSVYYTGRHNNHNNRKVVFGGMYYSETDGRFYGTDDLPIRFTPMQQRLVMMFWQTPNHLLTKEDICAELWPKKEDASDTFYTLIKRLKPMVENHTDLHIVSDRGRNYSLQIRRQDT